MSFWTGLAAGLAVTVILVLAFGEIAERWRLRALKALGVEPVAGTDAVLRGAIDERLKEGDETTKDRAMLGGVLELKELELTDVMVHRTKMTLIEKSAPPDRIIEEVLKSGHTRVPVWEDKPDNIVGILHAKDLLSAVQQHGGDASKIDIGKIMTQPWFVPGTRAAADQLSAFLRRKRQLAMVVDEYGEVLGLVTLEDILEEIVGEISDEHDAATAGVRYQKDGSFIIDGTVPVRDLNREFGWNLPDEEATTIAGLVIHEARSIPEPGQAFTFHGFRFEVLRKRKHQITSVRATPIPKSDETPGIAA
jgi:Mg2+/Co2+ transporter CorB